MKICRKHGLLKPENIYQEKNSNTISGFTNRCKFCKKERDKRDYDKNSIKRIKKVGEWKKKNRDRINEQVRLDRINNPEKHKEWARIGREKMGLIRTLKEVTRLRGITLEYYYQMVGRQNNLCEICKKNETRKNRNGDTARLCIDHNHITGLVRDLLCHGCNQVIGHARESIELLENAIQYLKKHNVIK